MSDESLKSDFIQIYMWKKMRILGIVVFTSILLLSCKKDAERKVDNPFFGKWKAQWDADAVSFPEAAPNSIFTMNGSFEFSEDQKVTVTAFGFPGCIFSADTLVHTLDWTKQNDTLNLVNRGEKYGIMYKILQLSESKMKLQLMEDIHITLTK
jgi:hypothetical protein